ncbi:MAG: PDR/VanB family oxidoreductase [Gemmobacter sp.]
MSLVELRVDRAEQAAEAIRHLVLVSDTVPLPAWTPGAHVEIPMPDGGIRHYSLVDHQGTWAAPESYRLGIRLEPEGRGGSRHMHSLSPGDRILVSEPKNGFPLDGGTGPALLIAGGIGVTPLVSMAAALAASGRDWRMIYAARSRDALAFGAELAALAGDRLTLHLDAEAGGVLDLGPAIAAASPGTHLYVCGPRPMIDAARRTAEAAGHAPGCIHFELFDTPSAEAGDQPFEVQINDGRVFTVPPGQSIIDVLEAGGVDLIHDCRRGDCGICRTDVRAGTPDHRDVVLTEAERASGKVMQICVSRAKGGRLVLDI